jgi:hypothetical protein
LRGAEADRVAVGALAHDYEVPAQAEEAWHGAAV